MEADAVLFSLILRMIQHPNMLTFMGSISEPRALIVITNLVHGPDLHRLIFDEQYERVSYIHVVALH